MKKNTLLYLDSALVKRAKNAGLNLSQVAEQALMRATGPNLSRAEVRCKHFREDLKLENRCFELLTAVKSVELTNIGLFEHKEIRFTKGLNAIIGPNMSGKTTLLRAIAYALGALPTDKVRLMERQPETITDLSTSREYEAALSKMEQAEVCVQIHPVSEIRRRPRKDHECRSLLLVEPTDILSKEFALRLIKELERIGTQGCQVIVDVSVPQSDLFRRKGWNVIELPEPDQPSSKK